MKRAVAASVFALLTLAWSPAPGTEPDAPGLGVRFDRGDGWSIVEATFDGRLVSYALPMTANGRREIFLLVAPADRDATADPEQREVDDEDEDRPNRLPPCPDSSGGTP